MRASAPSLVVAPLADERNRFDTYWDRLSAAAVRTPESRIVSLHATERGLPSWETTRVAEAVRSFDTERAFVRGAYKAAPRRLREASCIREPTSTEIDRTVGRLLRELDAAGWPHGDRLVVREWLDLDWCSGGHTACHPAVRFFVEDGRVLGWTPGADASFVCAPYDHLRERLAAIRPPVAAAERVADRFDDPWAVDFVADTAGDWYLLEAGLNAVRWDETSGWVNHCGHGRFKPFGPSTVHGAALRHARDDHRLDPH